MANANAIIIRKPKLYKIPTSSNLAHNSGISPATYWLFDSKSILQNIKFNDRKEIDDLWKKWEEEAKIRIAQLEEKVKYQQMEIDLLKKVKELERRDWQKK